MRYPQWCNDAEAERTAAEYRDGQPRGQEGGECAERCAGYYGASLAAGS